MTAATNKQLVLDGFAEFASGNVEILRTLLRHDFVEHSPGNPSGRDAFIEHIALSPVASARLELKRAVADDDYVILHYRMIGEKSDDAVVDIWRLEDGLIVEHWDVVQQTPPENLTPNGMF